MKNIVYIGKYNGIIGGIERYMQKSAELLRRKGSRVYYFYTEVGGKEQKEFAGAFDGVGELSFADERLVTADIVLIHNIIPGKLLSELPLNKTFFFAHDHNIYCQRHHYYTPVGRTNCHRKRNALLCNICSLGRNAAPPLAEYRKLPALVLSDCMAENLHKNGFEKVVKLPAFITPDDSNHTFMPGGVLRILFLGQLIRGKGADLMLEALAKLDIPFHCTIAGDGNDRAMLEEMVIKYGLQKKVDFTGFVPHPETLWENCDVFCFPIRWQEPFGLVGLEALAHGVPVVAFDLGGVREYLTQACGSLIPEKNIAKAAKALTGYYLNPELLSELGENGLWIAKNKFSEENFVKNFSSLTEVVQ